MRPSTRLGGTGRVVFSHVPRMEARAGSKHLRGFGEVGPCVDCWWVAVNWRAT